MKKNNKKHSKGFVLAETLIATVFVSVIFAIIYLNFYPLMGEYEKREYYDDVDSVYKAFILKEKFENHTPTLHINDIKNTLNNVESPYIDISNWKLDSSYAELKNELNIDKAIITYFNISGLQIALDDSSLNLYKNDPDFREYIYYINSYSNVPQQKENKTAYRLIVKFKNEYKTAKNSTTTDKYYSYANVEVDVANDK